MSRYHETYAHWKTDPMGFWAEAARAIDWIRPWHEVYARKEGLDRWFVGAECNTCWNAVDRHVKAGHGDRLAVIHDSAITGAKATYTYAQLLDEVATLAAVLEDLGIRKGDRVILYMPMVPEALFAMLACARLGAIHSVVFGGFAPPELATRINDAKPKAILTASCGIEPGRVIAYKPLLDQALDIAAHKVESCVVLQRPQVTAELKSGRDHDWADLLAVARGHGRRADCVAVKATDPLYILYTSGTTGQPKGVVRDNGGHMVALKWSMDAIYGIKPGEVYWAASDVGWVVGHSYIVYAPLLQGATTIVFEGKPVGTPDPGTFWRIVSEYKVAALFTAPTAFRAIKKEDPEGNFIRKYDLSSLRTLFLAGERADPDTVKWAETQLKVPVIDHWWQTETGWSIAANPVGLGMLPVKHGSPTVAMPGYDIQVLDEGGHEVKRGTLGAICVKLPLPPSCLPTLWGNDERFRKSLPVAFPRLLRDGGRGLHGRGRLPLHHGAHRRHHQRGGPSPLDGRHGRSARRPSQRGGMRGHRHRRCAQGPGAAGTSWSSSRASRKPAAEIETECVGLVREKIGAVAALRTVAVVPRLPKTRSGKILRGTMRKIADKEAFKTPATIDDPAILDEIRAAMQAKGVGV